MSKYKVGELVVYLTEKYSAHPSHRAQLLQPTPKGEFYSYEIIKYWKVVEINDGKVVIVTRRGKTRIVEATDENLRHAYWWERWFFSSRFPKV